MKQHHKTTARRWIIAVSLLATLTILGLVSRSLVWPWLKIASGALVLGIITCIAVIAYRGSTREEQMARLTAKTEQLPVLPPKPRRPPTSGAHLSWFAYRRIAAELPGHETCSVIAERRKSAWVLFLQLEKREPTGEMRRSRWRGRERPIYTPRSTIWKELFWLVVALLIALPLFVIAINAHDLHFVATRIILICAGLCPLLYTGGRFYIKFVSWFCWRLVFLRDNPDAGLDAKVVVIEKPLLLGGTVPRIDSRLIRFVSTATARQQKDETSLRSIIASHLGVEWLILDTNVQKDQRFNWTGPFRHAPELSMLIDSARRDARLE